MYFVGDGFDTLWEVGECGVRGGGLGVGWEGEVFVEGGPLGVVECEEGLDYLVDGAEEVGSVDWVSESAIVYSAVMVVAVVKRHTGKVSLLVQKVDPTCHPSSLQFSSTRPCGWPNSRSVLAMPSEG